MIKGIDSIFYRFRIPFELRLSIEDIQSSRSSQEGSRTFDNCVLLPIHQIILRVFAEPIEYLI